MDKGEVIKAMVINLFIIIYLSLTPVYALDYITGKVVHVADGDTITVVQAGQEYKIRLYGIDTPEKAQWYGQNAKAFTSSQVMGKRISVQKVDIDRYGRIVGIVSIGNLVLNRHLIEYGYAWIYHKYCNKPFCFEWAELEKKARITEKGLWKNSDVIPPWQYRHGNKSKTQGNDKDCSDFDTQAEAQKFFDAHGPGDPHRLDGNNDGEPCEGLP